jgi:hypothetical protein
VRELAEVLAYSKSYREGSPPRSAQLLQKFREELKEGEVLGPSAEAMPMFVISGNWYEQWVSSLSSLNNGLASGAAHALSVPPGPITLFDVIDHRYRLLHDPAIQKKYQNYAIYPEARLKVLPKQCWTMLR